MGPARLYVTVTQSNHNSEQPYRSIKPTVALPVITFLVAMWFAQAKQKIEKDGIMFVLYVRALKMHELMGSS